LTGKDGSVRIVDAVDKDASKGHILLMHDGGGNRDQTVAALPIIIKHLKARGYKLVTVSQLLGPNKRDIIFPAVPHHQEAIAGMDRIFFESDYLFRSALQFLFLIAIVLGIGRVLAVAPLALIQSGRAKKLQASGFAPPVTIIIPSYNEEAVIARTISAVLNSDYRDIRVIVIDDGSTDGTADVVESKFGNEPRLKLVRKENGGKSTALNLGISMSDTEIIICLDADTLFRYDTISKLVPHFSDPRVGAVAGNVKVGNRNNPITIWQSLEYITSQNLDRRAYAVMNAVSVVPGAVGAWRKSAILDAGGYETDTLAEDTDLTFRVLLHGYAIRTENSAIAFTEAPETIRTLAKQRFRWAFGTLQSLWKHRDVIFKRKHGAFSMLVMPAMWLYNIFFQAFSPIVDIAVIFALFSQQYFAVLTYYAAFFVLDFFGALLALELDMEDPKQLLWLFWQRFFYRQFMYYIIIKAIMAALRGGVIGWGKFQRKASVSVTEVVHK
jgi:poly-beta-1,6 N-acetyl-D-glucosamine synthase